MFFRDTFYKIKKLNNFICISIASLLICMLSSQCHRNICCELSTDHDRRLSSPWCYASYYQRNGGPYWRRQLFHDLSLTRSLKRWKRNHLVFPRLFLGTQHEKIKIRIANIYRHSRFFLATNNAVIRLEEAQKLNSIGVVRGNTMDVL